MRMAVEVQMPSQSRCEEETLSPEEKEKALDSISSTLHYALVDAIIQEGSR